MLKALLEQPSYHNLNMLTWVSIFPSYYYYYNKARFLEPHYNYYYSHISKQLWIVTYGIIQTTVGKYEIKNI